MSHSYSSPSGQDIIPAFPGLSARSIPENPDVQRETLRLLLQYSAGSHLSKSTTPVSSSCTDSGKVKDEIRDAWQTPRTEVSPAQVSSQPALPLNGSHANQHSSPSRSVSHSVAPSPASQIRVSTHVRPRPPSRAPSRLMSSQSVVAPSPTHGISSNYRGRQGTLRKGVAIPNSSTRDDTIALLANQSFAGQSDTFRSSSSSSQSSRANSPSIEMNSIRRSSRNRAQPVNYYADPWGKNRLDFEQPDTNLEANLDLDAVLPCEPQEPRRVLPRRANVQKLLYRRELGGGSHRPLMADVVSDLKPWKSWQGASGDLLILAWSPDGTQFAAGAAAKSDEHNMVYNKPKNLLLGDLQSNRLKEIPDHWIPRPTSSTVDDPRLFMTVNNMQWIGNRLYTASFDKTVKIWEVDSLSNMWCTHTLQHESRVATMSVSRFDPNVVATGTESILVWDTRDPENLTSTLLPLDRDARHKTNIEFSSTALAWGHTPSTKEFLLGGLAELGEDPIYKGHLGLWRARESAFETIRIASNSQNVFDIKWHSSLPVFATASPEDPHHARMIGIGTATKSLVRVFSLDCDLQKRVPSVMEFSCPALDVNEVTFCPMNSNGPYVTASCTDGKTYVWDNRKGDKILHELRHGKSLNPIDDQRSWEAADVGVRVALWGSSLDQFYTGASDGVLKRWDIRRSPEDVLVENVATFNEEIMCAAFTDDQSHLLVGGSGGGIHVLSSGTCSDPNITSFDFEHAPETEKPTDSGIVAGNELISSGQVVRHQIFGMGQGPSYMGPFAPWARNVKQDASSDQIGQSPLLKQYQDLQLDGPPPEDRPDLDLNQQRELAIRIQIAQIRNRGANNKTRQDHDDTSMFLFQHSAHLPSESRRLEKKRKRRKREEKGEDNGEDKARKKIRKKKIRQPPRPIISNTEDVDLTLLESDLETDMSDRHRFDLDELLEVLEEDNWFPGSGEIDPNFQRVIV
ncbi:hypothetical protein N7475_001222 [Penicillium sp. IBT 31633x]|nr:hypothetical protein N7475_001222 [Penicillium sp. IBT 31633x]